MKTKILLSALCAAFVIPALQPLRSQVFLETFDTYTPASFSTNVTNAFGDWRTVLMDGGSTISVTSAGAVPGNPTQVMAFTTANTDRASAINASMSYTTGVLNLSFDFRLDSANGSNNFFYANSTDAANTGAATTLFRLGMITSDERYRIGTEAATTNFSGTTVAQTLAFQQWYRFNSTIDLEAGTFSWQILNADSTPTAISFSNLSIYATSPKALESIWFGKIGASNNMTGYIDNISIIPESSTYALLAGALALLGVVAWRRRS